ncbi:C40 family peptidase [Nocardia yamanashiensis]|uniref:C40 family peptidase n=1 Tax=Nocardia yamanashiensis TaxID=209247 RepID=UPI001E3D480F|nr:C40 family peptidase [Nocardia yamanashiensis]UGT39504.1 C40 family peptidase [Nocardia yamanashiensis]
MSGLLDVGALARPIEALGASFGAGGASGSAALLREGSATIDEVHAAGRGGINGLYAGWQSRGGDAAMDKALRVQTSAVTLSDRGTAMAAGVERVEAAIAQGRKELEKILRSFLDSVELLGATAVSPAGITAIVGSAVDHLGRAVRVVERVRGELAGETAAMRELITPIPAPAPAGIPVAEAGGAVMPASVTTAANSDVAQSGSTVLSSGGKVVESGASMVSGLMTTPASSTGARGRDGQSAGRGGTAGAEPRTSPAGTGVQVTLPDGSTVVAPNQQAADAVRNALSAVGTPYVWGGTTPGAGLDCSGLTQWAYGEAGVRLPRLAQEQGDGHLRVGPGDLMPGDLAVWDGHVAMVIGNGQLVEAGDPVQVGAIRTENSGMRFLGFYRPTA